MWLWVASFPTRRRRFASGPGASGHRKASQVACRIAPVTPKSRRRWPCAFPAEGWFSDLLARYKVQATVSTEPSATLLCLVKVTPGRLCTHVLERFDREEALLHRFLILSLTHHRFLKICLLKCLQPKISNCFYKRFYGCPGDACTLRVREVWPVASDDGPLHLFWHRRTSQASTI